MSQYLIDAEANIWSMCPNSMSM